LLAAQGHKSPVNLIKESNLPEPEISHLTGFAKVSAAFAKKN